MFFITIELFGRTQEEFGNKNIEVNAEWGHKGKYFFDTKTKKIKIWEGGDVREFDLKKESLENILDNHKLIFHEFRKVEENGKSMLVCPNNYQYQVKSGDF